MEYTPWTASPTTHLTQIIEASAPHHTMQEPTEEAEGSIPMETVSNNGSNLDRTFAERRKAAKRTLPWDLAGDELNLVSPRPPPQAQDTPATKKPRLEEPCFSASIDQAARKLPPHDTAKRTLPWDLAGDELNLVSPRPPQAEDTPAAKKPRLLEEPFSASIDQAARKLPPQNTAAATFTATTVSHHADAGADHTDANPVKGTQATVRWTAKEDSNLSSAVTSTPKRKWGKQYMRDWAAIAALFPDRTKHQCRNRYHGGALVSNMDQAIGRTGKWSEDEDIKLKDAYTTHGGKNWDAIAVLVPGRKTNQCHNRWHVVLDPSIDRATGRTGKWSEDEDIKLKDAYTTHGGKNWAAIAAVVPGRTKCQCRRRWHEALDPSIDLATGRTGKWSEDEDIKLKDAVQTHGAKNWGAIAVLVPGRTKHQCRNRWQVVLDPSIDRATGRTGTWSEEEDIKLKDAFTTHGGKNWDAIAVLVPGRTKHQCRNRWHVVLDPSIDRATGRTGKWSEEEDIKLKDAFTTHGGKNWDAIAVLVPGRKTNQCRCRWYKTLDPNIVVQATGRKGKRWSKYEDIQLKDAVQTHGAKNWGAIAVLVPGRTHAQCYSRWHNALVPSIDRANERTGK
jgi:hypothetical protein